jgi:hypothetical protein
MRRGDGKKMAQALGVRDRGNIANPKTLRSYALPFSMLVGPYRREPNFLAALRPSPALSGRRNSSYATTKEKVSIEAF